MYSFPPFHFEEGGNGGPMIRLVVPFDIYVQVHSPPRKEGEGVKSKEGEGGGLVFPPLPLCWLSDSCAIRDRNTAQQNRVLKSN